MEISSIFFINVGKIKINDSAFVCVAIIGSIVAVGGLGYYIDFTFKTMPVFSIIGACIGLGIGIFEVYKLTKD